MNILRAILTKLRKICAISEGSSMQAVRWFEKGSNKEAEAVVEVCGETYGYTKDGELLYPLFKGYK